ncbi:P-protein [Anaerobiospirillum thomasii]|uniref:Bifunctional chorismate mutase/prephenate dehydratase n=1 Tax=Anaerobiospirillum thomasii TaxID=179995 RepID=A0A2X0VP92_9GAMM|nr:prephenate dehydratase [Anaerobiospirillum thomasii]SPT69972.1 P-protein [Anaerobiospirillum thomasii]SPT71378.1 P-protein [Anaerobiospirillum thomasii]
MRDLLECRDAIDDIDQKILKLLKERKAVALDIATYKLQHNQPITDKNRENEKISRLMQMALDLEISPLLVNDMYKIIMAHTVSDEQSFIVDKMSSRNYRRNTSVAYLGTTGTYSHLAAHKFLDSYAGKIQEKGCNSFADIIHAVESGICEFGVLPIENSSSGSINEVLDVIQTTKASIVGELFYPIDHSILCTDPATDLKDVTDIYSHPQPIAQCSHFISEHMPKARIHYTKATSDAMMLINEKKDKNIVAIGSKNAAIYYKLNSIVSDIANNHSNFTRFVVMSMTPISIPTFVDAKTSIIFTTKKYEPGSLVAVLNEFNRHHINLTKLHSRPREGQMNETWEEIFFADVQANLDTSVMQEIMSNLVEHTGELKILGCYASCEKEQRN